MSTEHSPGNGGSVAGHSIADVRMGPPRTAMKLFVVLVYGPPCSGKSAVVEYLMARHDGLFRISADRIKWFVSGYDEGHYRNEVARVILDMAASALSQGLPLLVEANATIHKRMWPGYLALAEQQEAAFHEIALEAPLQILDARLEQRVRSSVARRKKSRSRTPPT